MDKSNKDLIFEIALKFLEGKDSVNEEEMDRAIDGIIDLRRLLGNPIELSYDERKQLKSELLCVIKTVISEDDHYITSDDDGNKTWWTDLQSLRSDADNPYWNGYEKYASEKEHLSKDVRTKIGERADTVMNNLFNPMVETLEEKRRFGMVIGSVQSGKTANYSGLICKAADAGFKIIVIIAGSTSILRQQTQVRIRKSFVGKYDKNYRELNEEPEYTTVNTVSECRNLIESKEPISLTKDKINGDFNKRTQRDMAEINLNNTTAPLVFVIKKNKTILEEVSKWVKRTNQYQYPLLLIDDEADNASLNTKKNYKEERTAINRGIRAILNSFSKSAYVGYTATPFANVFIDPLFDVEESEKDLFPRDFIVALESPDNYFGPRVVFGDEGESEYVVPLADPGSEESKEDWEQFFPLSQKKDETQKLVTGLPDSLKEAVRLFVLNIAVRNERGFDKEHNTMLIHVSRLVDMHKKIAEKVEEYVKTLKQSYYQFCGLPKSHADYIKYVLPFENIFSEFHGNGWNSDTSIKETSFEDIKFKISAVIDSLEVGTSNTKTKITFSEDHQTNMIAIGGNAFARGFTLPGLSVSYFIRNTSACDTLLQMGRWFGYRPNYQDLCRVFIPPVFAFNFAKAADSYSDLMKSVTEMEGKKKPTDFLLTVSQHPETRMLLTAMNKMRNASEDKGVYLDGQIKEKGTVRKDNLINYYPVVERFLDSLPTPEHGKLKESYFYRWLDVPAERICELIKNCPEAFNYDISSDLIENYVRQNKKHNWRIVMPDIGASVWDQTLNWKNVHPVRRNDKYYSSAKISESAKKASYSFSVTDLKSEQMGMVGEELGYDNSEREKCRENRKEPLLIITIANLFYSKKDEACFEEKFPFLSLSFAGSFSKPVFEPLLGFVYNEEVNKKLLKEREEEESADDDEEEDEDDE